MTYAEALGRLFALRRFGVRPGLEPTQAALAALGHPERAFPAIHVAGTNGKGSVAAMCAAALRGAGRRVGLYTSPHLQRFTERFVIDGAELAPPRLAALIDEVLAAGPTLTFFEVATVAAFLAFQRAGIEIAVIEVGLGGRLDATNTLARPLVSAITGVALDHTDVLGDTIAAIAREKAGILRAGVPAVVGRVDEEAWAAIAGVAAGVGAPLARIGVDFAIEPAAPALRGDHQRGNAAVARAALLRLPVSVRPASAAIDAALAAVRWPGRLEPIGDDLLLDGAHNPDGATALAAALPGLAGDRPVTLVLGAVEDKDAARLFAPLLPLARRVIATSVPNPRGRAAASLAGILGPCAEVIADPRAAVAAARAGGGLTVVAGSLFLVGAVRAWLLGEPVDPVAVSDPPARSRQNL